MNVTISCIGVVSIFLDICTITQVMWDDEKDLYKLQIRLTPVMQQLPRETGIGRIQAQESHNPVSYSKRTT